ncbi:hypothetical protein FDECE_11337 [Fusarium decemcellulare]|nr:hypothetical protein FDECE_11337 [Fusarium decemcellulare]
MARSIYLLVYNSRLFPAHWVLWIPSKDNTKIGKVIEAAGDVATGFDITFERNFNIGELTRTHELVELAQVDDDHIVDTLGDGSNYAERESEGNLVAQDKIEEAALRVPAPVKSLRSASSVSRSQVELRNCQTWILEVMEQLVKDAIVDEAVLEVWSEDWLDSGRYFPFELGECEDPENYEPGGFHPVHLDDVYDGRYRVTHKLGFGGFSTVWLAADAVTSRWVALKMVAARESSTYRSRSVITDHLSILGSRFFIVADRQFWVDGPNGRHLCLVCPALGPNMSRISRGIYSRIKPNFAIEVSLQAAQGLAQLHSNGLGHGDFTTSNIVLRLKDDFDSYTEGDLVKLFGRPQTAPLRTYSGEPPGPHGPNYIVVPLEFCFSTTNLLSSEICIIDFDQSFTTAGPPPERPGIPAKYMAPEVAVGRPSTSASDIWALGCAIFRTRSGDDIFFDYDTNCPEDALRQIEKTLGPLPDEWKDTKFDPEGLAVVDGGNGEPYWSLDETQPLKDRVYAIFDEPPSLFISREGEAVEIPDEEVDGVLFDDDAAMRVPYSPAFSSMVWRPTAVCVAGTYMAGYTEETDGILEAFPIITEREEELLLDLLSKIFTYDTAKRLKADEVAEHPWFSLARTSK